MGIKCPKCNSVDTASVEVEKMHCKNCAYSWKPYKHRGKKMKMIGDGLLTTRRKIMPGSKTRVVGDGILFPKKRVKKVRRKKESFF